MPGCAATLASRRRPRRRRSSCTWRPGGTGWGFTWAVPDGGGPDLALFDGILAEIGRSYCLDRSAIFLVGHSLGASFANEIACARATVVKGLASVAGGIGSGRCPGGRVPALLLHTDGDGATAAKAVLASVTPAKAQPAAAAKYCDLNVMLSIPIFG